VSVISLVQLAKIAGARVIGITGSDAKNRMLQDEPRLLRNCKPALPKRFQATYERRAEMGQTSFSTIVGGPVLDSALPLMAVHGRVVCLRGCGEL